MHGLLSGFCFLLLFRPHPSLLLCNLHAGWNLGFAFHAYSPLLHLLLLLRGEGIGWSLGMRDLGLETGGPRGCSGFPLSLMMAVPNHPWGRILVPSHLAPVQELAPVRKILELCAVGSVPRCRLLSGDNTPPPFSLLRPFAHFVQNKKTLSVLRAGIDGSEDPRLWPSDRLMLMRAAVPLIGFPY